MHKQGDRVAIYACAMDRTDESFPDVVAAVAKIPGDFLIDGEIVPFKSGKVLPFALKTPAGKVLTPRILDNPRRSSPSTFSIAMASC